MEANSTSLTLYGLLKWLFPSLVGAVLAVWFKRNDIEWSDKTTLDKALYTLIGVCAVVFGCVIGFTIAQVIITYANISDYWYGFGIHIGSGLVSLKVLDAIIKNTDDLLTIITTGVKNVVKKFFNKIGGG